MRLLLPLYITAQTFLLDRAQAFQRRREAGQGTMEYVGMVVLVAAALVVVLKTTGQFDQIGKTFKDQIGKIADGISSAAAQ